MRCWTRHPDSAPLSREHRQLSPAQDSVRTPEGPGSRQLPHRAKPLSGIALGNESCGFPVLLKERQLHRPLCVARLRYRLYRNGGEGQVYATAGTCRQVEGDHGADMGRYFGATRSGADFAGPSRRRVHADRRPDRCSPCQESRSGARFRQGIHVEHRDVDGLLYASRLTGEDVYAVFDRGIAKLTSTEAGALVDHPELPDVLARHGIGLVG